MRTIYNGLDLLCLELHDFAVEAVYDDTGVDYLYTRAFIHETVVINGDVKVVDLTAPGPFISYAFGGPQEPPIPGTFRNLSGTFPTPTMPPAAGIDVGNINNVPRSIIRIPNAPPLTHAVIRHRLKTPRGQLYVFAGPGMESGIPEVGSPNPPIGPIILSSPGLSNVCDCKNGPIPKILALNAALGDSNTFIAEWMCETYFNEAQQNNTSPISALLSNRFHQSQTVDDEGFTTVVTQGTAIYRTDSIFTLGISPDFERPVLFMPIPQGFVRRIDYVDGLPDVTGVTYGYTDTQQKTNFVAGPYTKAASINILHRQAVSTGEDILSGALSLYERNIGLLLNTKWLRDKDKPAHVPAAVPGGPGAGRLRVPKTTP